MKFVLTITQFSRHKAAINAAVSFQSEVQSCLRHWDVNDVWLYCRPPSFLHHLLSPKSSLVTLLFSPCPLRPTGTLHVLLAVLFLLLLLFLCSLPASSPCSFSPSYSSYYIILFNPHNEPFLLYLLLLFIYLPHWPFCSLALCQSLCEFYANHCARIEALRRQLQEEQRGRQVEHTATAGPGWYCSWDIL